MAPIASQPPTLHPGKLFLGTVHGDSIDWHKASAITDQAIALEPAETIILQPRTMGTLSFRIKGDFRALWPLLGLPYRKWRRLTYKTNRAHCAKRNRHE